MSKQPWFHNGLRFQCTECGKCCTGSPGYVFLSPKDLSRIATYLNISKEAFLKTYTRKVDGALALIDTPKTDACCFLQNNQCSIYTHRPVQCRTFPWWIYHLEDPKSWEEAATHCEGINHKDAPIVPFKHIEKELRSYLDNVIEQNFS